MYGVDILLQQAIIAAFTWVVIATYAQQKWYLFTTFFGKKYGPIVAIATYSVAWVQCIVVGVITFKSHWRIDPSIALGTLVLTPAFYLLYTQKSTPFSLRKKRTFTALLRLHIPYALLLLGIGFSSGQLGILLSGFTYAICALFHAALTSSKTV